MPRAKRIALLLSYLVFLLTAAGLGYETARLWHKRTHEVRDAVAVPDDVYVPTLVARNSRGILERVSFTNGNKPTVLYVVSPGCAWCERNLPGVLALAEQVAESHTLLALSLAPVPLRESHLSELPLPRVQRFSSGV